MGDNRCVLAAGRTAGSCACNGRQGIRTQARCGPAKPARRVLEAIVYVLRTGCQCKALPKERFGSASAIRKRLLEWEAAGFFGAL